MWMTDEYKMLLAEKHKEEDWGNSALYWINYILELSLRHDCKTILDYGSGKGALKSRLEHIEVLEYDPPLEKYDCEMCDMLVCVDVMEHVEPQYTLPIIQNLSLLYRKSYFIAIDTKPAKHLLPDGRNAHINLKTHQEWCELLQDYFAGDIIEYKNYVICYE
jgi:hypothetical protein